MMRSLKSLMRWSLNINIIRKICRILLLYFNIRGSSFLRHKFSHLIPIPRSEVVITSTLFGSKLLVDIRDHIGRYIFLHGLYEEGMMMILRKILRRGDIFIDVRAYIGDIACIVSHFVGKNGLVIAIEPSYD